MLSYHFRYTSLLNSFLAPLEALLEVEDFDCLGFAVLVAMPVIYIGAQIYTGLVKLTLSWFNNLHLWPALH